MPPIANEETERTEPRRRELQAQPTPRQLAVPALVTFLSVAALVMFLYGFCKAVR